MVKIVSPMSPTPRSCRYRLKEKGGIVVKGKIHKKPTFEDKFDRKYACWVKNHPKAWHWYKVQNRKLFRRKVSQEEKE